MSNKKWKNAVGTEEKKCKCGRSNGEWIDHWRRQSQVKEGEEIKCATGCGKIATEGAHIVHCDQDADKEPFNIVPMCKSCNGEKENLPEFFSIHKPASDRCIGIMENIQNLLRSQKK